MSSLDAHSVVRRSTVYVTTSASRAYFIPPIIPSVAGHSKWATLGMGTHTSERLHLISYFFHHLASAVSSRLDIPELQPCFRLITGLLATRPFTFAPRT